MQDNAILGFFCTVSPQERKTKPAVTNELPECFAPLVKLRHQNVLDPLSGELGTLTTSFHDANRKRRTWGEYPQQKGAGVAKLVDALL